MLTETRVCLSDVVEKLGVKVGHNVSCLAKQGLNLRQCNSGLVEKGVSVLW